MEGVMILVQLIVVLTMIFIGAKVGGIGLGIYGMAGVFVLVFVFGLEPGAIPIDVMLIIVSVITASASLQAAGGMDYMVNVAARFLKRHPNRITYRPGHLWYGWRVCAGVRVRTGTGCHPHRRDADYRECHYGFGITAGGWGDGLYGERGCTISEKTP